MKHEGMTSNDNANISPPLPPSQITVKAFANQKKKGKKKQKGHSWTQQHRHAAWSAL